MTLCYERTGRPDDLGRPVLFHPDALLSDDGNSLRRQQLLQAVVARQMGRAAGGISDNPQLFIYGSGRIPPGPGEPGFGGGR